MPKVDDVYSLSEGEVIVLRDRSAWMFAGRSGHLAGFFSMKALCEDGRPLFTTSQSPAQIQHWLDKGAKVYVSAAEYVRSLGVVRG